MLPEVVFKREACHVSKQYLCSKAIFYLVHVDAYGPYKVPSLSINKYFIAFIDDFSRATWLFLYK